MKWPGAFIVALLFATTELSAQVKGVVRDTTGRPLEGAVVDFWSGPTRTGRVVTTTSGKFEFRDLIGGGRLTVRRIGSRPFVTPVTPADTALVVILQGSTVALEEIEVSGGCSRREDRAARQMWERAAAMYREVPETLAVENTFKSFRSRLPFGEVGTPVVDSNGYGETGYRGIARSFGEREIASRGYPAPDPERSEVFTNGLTVSELQHLVSPGFGSRVRFRTLGPSRIGFCPRERKQPWIEGEIRLAEDGSVLVAEWRYGSRTGGWRTGAVATFVAPASDSTVPLLPSSFVLWAERGSGMAAQWAVEFREWNTTPPYEDWYYVGHEGSSRAH